MAQGTQAKRFKLETQIKQETCQESRKSYYSRKNNKIKARKRFRKLGMWMIAKKATSTPLNPKSKV